jgi:hypothetical protein
MLIAPPGEVPAFQVAPPFALANTVLALNTYTADGVPAQTAIAFATVPGAGLSGSGNQVEPLSVLLQIPP